MSPDRLGTALRDLVDDVEEGVAPPVADDLWAGGRRRRRTARLAPLLAAACVAALLALLVWPSGAPQASVPAIGVDGSGAARLTAYPSVIAKPLLIDRSARPGVTAAVLTEASDPGRTYAVSPSGSVTQLKLPDTTPGQPLPALSPDGGWLARGPELTDLVRGVTIPSLPARDALASSRVPANDPAWWSPDSSRVLVVAFNQGEPKSSGLVVDTDGSMTEVPLLAGGSSPIVAGWLDEQTLLAFVDIGSDLTVLQGRTWRVGDPAWEESQAFVSWPPTNLDGDETSQDLRATLSPDGSRLLMTALVTDPDNAQNVHTRAMMFDPATGAQLGMPQSDGVVDPEKWAPGSFAEWQGGGCRPAWHDGLPVITDGGVTGFVDTDLGGVIDGRSGSELVSVSGRYDDPCVVFAGDELRGTPVADSTAVWQERIYVWGGRLVLAGLFAGVVWWVRRQRRWSGLDSSPRPIFPGRV